MGVNRLSVAPDLLEAALRHHRGESSQEDEVVLGSIAFSRLAGGKNNGVYRAHADGTDCCIKIFKVDVRQRGKREWESLLHLRGNGIDYVPTPYQFTTVDGTAVLVMELVRGSHLGHRYLSQDQLEILACRVKRLHVLPFEGRPENARVFLAPERVNGLIGSMKEVPVQDQSTAKCQELWHTLSRGPELGLLRQTSELVFSRMDTSLANLMWDGVTIRVVDLEYGGWTERVFDLAEQVEHVQSRGTPDSAWDWYLQQFSLKPEERIRLRGTQRLLAFDCARRFWPAKDGRSSDNFVEQVERVSRLCQA